LLEIDNMNLLTTKDAKINSLVKKMITKDCNKKRDVLLRNLKMLKKNGWVNG